MKFQCCFILLLVVLDVVTSATKNHLKSTKSHGNGDKKDVDIWKSAFEKYHRDLKQKFNRFTSKKEPLAKVKAIIVQEEEPPSEEEEKKPENEEVEDTGSKKEEEKKEEKVKKQFEEKILKNLEVYGLTQQEGETLQLETGFIFKLKNEKDIKGKKDDLFDRHFYIEDEFMYLPVTAIYEKREQDDLSITFTLWFGYTFTQKITKFKVVFPENLDKKDFEKFYDDKLQEGYYVKEYRRMLKGEFIEKYEELNDAYQHYLNGDLNTNDSDIMLKKLLQTSLDFFKAYSKKFQGGLVRRMYEHNLYRLVSEVQGYASLLINYS